MKEIIVKTTVKVYSVAELSEEFKELAQAALSASTTAYAPYSKFHVGAAVRLESGVIITGNNQENAAYPSGLCAERVALFYAGATYPGVAVRAIAIAAQTGGRQVDMITPCGACRQVLLETESRYGGHPMDVLLCGTEQVYIISGAASLLPLSFSGSDLGVTD
ncbi:MAG: cytidine deaminase [Tannerellaceae bacterium]|jgi:cytidine deaminase|nr:cytidine deaminase [Tannerellaceae bacterium]